MEWRVLSDRAAGGSQRVAQGQCARGATAGWDAGGAVWREIFAGDQVRNGIEEGAGAAVGGVHRQASPAAAGQRLESEFRFKESAEDLASSAEIGLPTRRGMKMATCMTQQEVARRQSSPFTGKPRLRVRARISARPAGKPGIFPRQREFATIPPRHWLPAPIGILRALSMRFPRHVGIYLVRWGFKL